MHPHPLSRANVISRLEPVDLFDQTVPCPAAVLLYQFNSFSVERDTFLLYVFCAYRPYRDCTRRRTNPQLRLVAIGTSKTLVNIRPVSRAQLESRGPAFDHVARRSITWPGLWSIDTVTLKKVKIRLCSYHT